MNKKFISALLFGAMLFAPASMFVSCSYDDDIAELRNDLNATKTDLSSLVDEKMKNVDAEIAALGAQAEALEAAYEAANEALQEAIANATNDAKGYADVQAAQAQAASIAAAQKMVEDAKAALEAALATVNTTVAEQGKSIAALLEADKELTVAISAAQARAEEAFALASQAKELATKNAADVEALSKVVEGLKATLTTLSEQVTVLGENVTKALDEAKKNEAAIAAQAEALKALEASNAEALKTAKGELQDAIDANAKEIENLKKAVDAAKTEAATLVAKAEDVAAKALAAAKTELQDAINANTLKIEEVKAAYKEADDALKAELLAALDDMNAALTVMIENNKAELAKVNANLAYQGKKLKSLVFSPTLYYHGIEAFGVYSFNYMPAKELVAGDLEKNQKDLRDLWESEAAKKVSFVPNEMVSYIMNPSNALVSKDVKNYNFVVNHAKTTRAANTFESANINVTKAETTADGKLNVTISLTNPDWIKQLDNAGDGNVDVVALKYTDKGENGADTTVISDFAAIKHYQISGFEIYAKGNPCAKLADSPNDAINNGPKFTVAYNKTINFNELLDVHYIVDGVAQEWGDYNEIAKKGFSLQYELMGYISGTNQTNESKHARLSGSVLTPQNVDGTSATRNCVGRTPLVRVKLVDGNNNKIADLGYTIVTITDVFVDPIVKGAYNTNYGYEVACENTTDFSIGNMMTWLQFETDILGDERINISKSDFALLYELDLVNNDYAKQFTQKADGSFETAGVFGKVRMTASDNQANETNVLYWTVSNYEAYNWFKWNNNPVNTSKTVFVRFKPVNTDDQNYHRPYIYIKLSWTPEYIRTKPEAAIKDADKVAATWYAADSKEQGTSDLHAHVQEAKSGNSCVFDFSVDKHTFKKADGTIVSVAEVIKEDMKAKKYTKVADNTKISFKFAHTKSVPAATSKAGSSEFGEAYYDLRIDGTDSNKLQARHGNGNWSDVAVLNVTSGSIEYQTNAVAKDILNYSSSQELAIGQSLTVKVEVVAKTCAPANDVYLSGHQMNVKFLRPVNLSDEAVEVVDSDPSTHTVALGKGKDFELVLTDWRGFDNNEVYASSNKAYNLYQFYGVTSIKQDGKRGVMSNFANGGSADLDKCTVLPSTDFEFKFIESTALDSKNQGSISYKKNTTVTVHDFTAYVPVVVEYAWGKLYTWVRVDVKATINN